MERLIRYRVFPEKCLVIGSSCTAGAAGLFNGTPVVAHKDESTIIMGMSDDEASEQEQEQEPGRPVGKCLISVQPMDGVHNSQLFQLDTVTGRETPLFDSSVEQAKYSNLMPTLSPDSKRIAFVSNRNESGIDWMVRLWVADIDGQNAASAPASAA